MPDDPGSRRPRVMLVTARRQLLEATGRPLSSWPALLVEQIEAALAGGVDLIQVREPDVDARTLIQFLRELFRSVPQSRSRTVVNERLDVALATEAAGVHLPERSLPVDEARRLGQGSDWLVGRSVHAPAGAARSASASYLVAGTVLRSPSKDAGATLLGWDGLKEVVERAGTVPVLAIGGMTEASIGHALAAGASGIAAIGYFIPKDAHQLARFVRQRAASIVSLFDSYADLS